jgi:hypothetical protein
MKFSRGKRHLTVWTAVLFAASTTVLALPSDTDLRSLGITRMVAAQFCGMNPCEGEPARLVALAQATSTVTEVSLNGQMNARNEALQRALSEAKRKIAAAVELGEGKGMPVGGCRLLDCVFTKSADGKNESAAVAVEWTSNRQEWSVSEAISSSRAEVFDVVKKQFHSPKADVVTVDENAGNEMTFFERIGAELRAKVMKESLPTNVCVKYFRPLDMGSYLREFVPALATNRYDGDCHVVVDVAGSTYTSSVTRASLGLHALNGMGLGSFGKIPDNAVSTLSSISNVNDVVAINEAITNAVGSLRKPTINPGLLAALLHSKEVEFTELPGPLEIYDNAGFLHHVGCGVVPLDTGNILSRRSSKKRAEQVAAAFATYSLAAHVSSDKAEAFLNPDFRSAVVYSVEIEDESTSKSFAIAFVEALY